MIYTPRSIRKLGKDMRAWENVQSPFPEFMKYAISRDREQLNERLNG